MTKYNYAPASPPQPSGFITEEEYEDNAEWVQDWVQLSLFCSNCQEPISDCKCWFEK